MRIGFALAALAASALAAPSASAQYYHTRRPAYVAPGYYAPVAGGFYCRPSCPQDTTPCDPPEFKRADGRCTNPASGGFR